MELINKASLLDWFIPFLERGESIPACVVVADIANRETLTVTRCKECLFAGAQIGGEVWCNAHLAVFKQDSFCDGGRAKNKEQEGA